MKFLKQVAKAYPRVKLHVVADNYATHKHPAVKAWLARNPRITTDFTPTCGSWMNLVEVFFRIITRQATWVKDADTILAKATRPKTANTQGASATRH